MEGLKEFAAAFVAGGDPAVVLEPRQGSFNNKPQLAQATAMGRIACQGNQRLDSLEHQRQDHLAIAIPPVTLTGYRLMPHIPRSVGQCVESGEECQGRLVIAPVGRRDPDRQRNAMEVGDDVAFAAVFRPVGAVRPGVRPPKNARMDAESMTTCRGSISPKAPHHSRIFLWSLGHTSRALHSSSRRQTVAGDPQPSSWQGKYLYWQPVLSRYKIPARQLRLGTGGRPRVPGSFSGGSRGSIDSQSSSGTIASCKFMAEPPG